MIKYIGNNYIKSIDYQGTEMKKLYLGGKLVYWNIPSASIQTPTVVIYTDDTTKEFNIEGALSGVINFDTGDILPTQQIDNVMSSKSVVIGESVTSIIDAAFVMCESITSVTIPNSVTSIGMLAFGYTALPSIEIPNSVTEIGMHCFEGCGSLSSVTIGDGVTSIGDNAFIYCNSLTSVTYTGTMAQWNAITKGDWRGEESKITVVHCSDGDISS